MIEGFKKKENCFVTNVNNKKVLLNTSTGKYFLLNEISSKIWDYIDSESIYTFQNLLSEFEKTYVIDEVIFMNDIHDWISKLREYDLISHQT